MLNTFFSSVLILITFTFIGSGNCNDTTVPVLLLLYEFETKARLGNTDLEKILHRAVALPYADAKVFEIMAGIRQINIVKYSLTIF